MKNAPTRRGATGEKKQGRETELGDFPLYCVFVARAVVVVIAVVVVVIVVVIVVVGACMQQLVFASCASTTLCVSHHIASLASLPPMSSAAGERGQSAARGRAVHSPNDNG